MKLHTHPELSIKKLCIGAEESPLLVVDNFVNEVDDLINFATQLKFEANSNFYPGIRAEASLAYQQFVLENLQQTLLEFFQLKANKLKFALSHYSLVTSTPSQLHLLQRIPHFDSLDSDGLAAVHYLFKGDLGGTSFYKHRDTQFESVNESRRQEYFESMKRNGSNNMPSAEYINGDTVLYERISKQQGIFNRIIIYRRNVLHSGSISKEFVPDDNPLTGRLSINSFIDPY
ncbi:MAG: hypothetical protein KUG78_05985 [Kangiellaceae bacterium]|nr:hypothetical protein [Kangiellaceae bacterium]